MVTGDERIEGLATNRMKFCFPARNAEGRGKFYLVEEWLQLIPGK
jgi:hypothetical protein